MSATAREWMCPTHGEVMPCPFEMADEPLTRDEEARWRQRVATNSPIAAWLNAEVARLIATLDAERLARIGQTVETGGRQVAPAPSGQEPLPFNHAEALQLDGPVVIAQSDTDPGDMGEPRMFVSDGVTHLTVPSFRLWGAIDCVLHDHTGPCIPETA